MSFASERPRWAWDTLYGLRPLRPEFRAIVAIRDAGGPAERLDEAEGRSFRARSPGARRYWARRARRLRTRIALA